MAKDLSETRAQLRARLTAYGNSDNRKKTEEQASQEEAAYAASDLKSERTSERVKAIEFLELLSENIHAQDFLIKALDDKENSVVQKAVHALGKVAKPSALPKLKKFMETSRSKYITSEIMRTISRLEREELE